MELRDLIPVIAGIAIVLAIAILAHSPSLTGPSVQAGQPAVSPTGSPTLIPVEIVVNRTWTPVSPTPALSPQFPLNLTTTSAPSPTPTLPVIEPYQIFYTNDPMSYPLVRLPEHMEVYGASDIPDKYKKNVPFAYIEEQRGGLTEIFNIPYQYWVINVTVTADRYPQYAWFRMALCSAKTGEIYEGAELYYPGTIYKNVQVSNMDMYLIISIYKVDRFRIIFETPQGYLVNTSG